MYKHHRLLYISERVKKKSTGKIPIPISDIVSVAVLAYFRASFFLTAAVMSFEVGDL